MVINSTEDLREFNISQRLNSENNCEYKIIRGYEKVKGFKMINCLVLFANSSRHNIDLGRLKSGNCRLIAMTL